MKIIDSIRELYNAPLEEDYKKELEGDLLYAIEKCKISATRMEPATHVSIKALGSKYAARFVEEISNMGLTIKENTAYSFTISGWANK